MHILILASWYPERAKPYKGIFVQQQSEALADMGLKTGLLFVQKSLKSSNHEEMHRRATKVSLRKGVHVFQYEGTQKFVFLPYSAAVWWVLRGVKLFKRYVREEGRPDVLHAHAGLYGGLLGVLLGHLYRIPVILTEHSSALVEKSIPVWQQPLVSLIFRLVDERIAVSKTLAQALSTFYGPNLSSWKIIPNLVARVYADRPLQPRLPRIHRFISVGHLIKLKGHRVLLQAFAKLFEKKQEKHLLLRIIGDGEEENALKDYAKSLGIADHVEWIGSRKPEEMVQDYDVSHTLVSSSEIETFGVTLIEGLSRGLPVIATRSGGPEQWVTKQIGELTEIGDIDGLAGKMQHVLDNIDHYVPEKMREYCLSRFGPDAIGGQLKKIYQSHV